MEQGAGKLMGNHGGKDKGKNICRKASLAVRS